MSEAVITKSEQNVFVVGHMNPDTDSICSAIAYANLKEKITGEKYTPKRAGQISPETEFVLNHFGIKTPGFISDVREQVKDMTIRVVPTLHKQMSLKAAWDVMDQETLSTLPILNEDKKLEGLISVADIAKSYMNVYDTQILAKAKTPYQNLLDVLEGTMLVGNPEDCVENGKVLIGAANPEMMENFVEEGDIVLVGDRYEAQLCAIEMRAKCIVVCTGADVAKTICRMAENRGCAIIQTKYDTFVASRLMNQSMPIDFFMRKEGFVTFTTEDYLDDIKSVMAEKRHRDFPILDKEGRYVGMISRRNLLNVKKKDTDTTE